MNIFKKYKKALVYITSIIVALYAIFLFVLPNVINLNNYKKDIQKIVYNISKLNFDFENIKIVTTPTLKAGINAKGLKLTYPNGKQIATLNQGTVKVSLLPLLLAKLQVSDILIDSPSLSLTMQKNGQLDILEYITKNVVTTNSQDQSTPQELPIKISEKLPIVIIKNYKLSLLDDKSKSKISINGELLVLDDAIINKHLRITSNGSVYINNQQNINYNVRLATFWPVITPSAENQAPQELPQIDIIKELVKFNPEANLECDLIIKEKAGSILLSGYLNADKLSLKLDGKKLPDSYFHLKSVGNKTNLDTDLYINNEEKLDVNAIFTHSKNFKIDLNVKTERISFDSIKTFLEALLNSFYIKNDLNMFNTKGFIKADFALKTDMKKFESDGYFKVLDGSIIHKSIPLKINTILADINFTNNSLNINNAIANINGTEIIAKGFIDSNSNTNIIIKSGKLNLVPLFNAFAPSDIKSSCNLNSGIFSLDIVAKGKLSKIQPTVNAYVKDFILKTKTPLPIVAISTKEAKVDVTPQEIKIVPFDVSLNSSKINISGDVKDYFSKMKINIVANGNLVTNDLKNLLPKEIKSFIDSKGIIPIKAVVLGDLNKININAQAYTTPNGHFSPFTIKKMYNKTGIVNFAANYTDDKLNIDDIGLYTSNKQLQNDNLASNIKSAIKIAGANGNIANLLTSHPFMKFYINIPEQLTLTMGMLPKSSIKVRGDLTVSGDIYKIDDLLYKGFFTINDVNIPEILTKVQSADLELNGDSITAKVQNLNLNDTSLNIDATASTKFTKTFLIKTMNVTCPNFDVDKIFKVMDEMNKFLASSGTPVQQANVASNAPILPVKISNGKIDIQKFVMKQLGGNLEATNIAGDFTLVNDLFKLNNLKAIAFKGNIIGDITYNLKTTAVTAKVKGQKIDANPAVTVFVGIKDQIMGNVDFNADVRLKGVTYEEQMKTLNGKVDFGLKDGQMGSLGSFETFLKADNLLTQSFISSKVGNIISTVAPYKTGKFAYLNGVVNIHNGLASLDPIKMSGPHMALLLSGNVNILTMMSNLEILGYLSSDVMGALGPVGDLSLEKFTAYIPKFGSKITTIFNNYNQAMKQADLDKIPSLTPANNNARAFKVVLNGNLNNPPSAIKKFQWLNTPEKIAEEQNVLQEATASKIPATKEEIKEQLKNDVKQGITNAIQNNEKIQEIQKNSTVKSLTDIYKFYKKSTTEE